MYYIIVFHSLIRHVLLLNVYPIYNMTKLGTSFDKVLIQNLLTPFPDFPLSIPTIVLRRERE